MPSTMPSNSLTGSPKKMPEMERQMEELQKSVCQLQSDISELELVLNTVLRRQNPSTDGSEVAQPELTPLATKLREQVRYIQNASSYLRDIKERLEIKS